MSIRERTCAYCGLPLTTAKRYRRDNDQVYEKVTCHDATLEQAIRAAWAANVAVNHPVIGGAAR